ncbi:MAG TPA: 4Fe-4S dicluster domain-containing protein [Ktedonobacterales bacterium]
MHRSRSQVAEELAACIRCNECLIACPALSAPITIKTLNRETMGEPMSPEVAQFAKACYQCGACVPVCPVGLHRDAMMLWLKMRLLRGEAVRESATPAGVATLPGSMGGYGDDSLTSGSVLRWDQQKGTAAPWE